MTEQAVRVINIMISWSFLMFFLILAGERMCSIARIIKDKTMKLTDSAFDIYVNFITMAAVSFSLIMLIIEGKSFWVSLFNGGVSVNYTIVVCAATILLISGMVHTEFTQNLTQFLAYGFLFAAMILRTIVNIDTGAESFGSVYSLVYLMLFSMAVPVVYKSKSEEGSTLFHIVEAAGSIILVICFGVLLRYMFIGRGENLLLWLPMIILAITDTVIVTMNRDDKKAYFLLSFEVVTAAVFLAGKILMALR